MHSFSQFLPTTSLFSNCSACSPNVIKAFQEGGAEFMIQACNEPKYLEELSGLLSLLSDAALEDVVSDDDSLSTESS